LAPSQAHQQIARTDIVMTMRNLAIRLSVTDAQKVKATLNDVGESGQRAIRKVEEASRPASKALLALDGATGTLRGTFEGMTARLGPLGGALSRLGPAGLAAGAALGALTGIIAKGVANFWRYVEVAHAANGRLLNALARAPLIDSATPNSAGQPMPRPRRQRALHSGAQPHPPRYRHPLRRCPGREVHHQRFPKSAHSGKALP
jgi:hypothetical protein